MATACCRGLFLVPLVFTLGACALLSGRPDMPLAGVNCRQALPLGYEVRATLQVGPAGQDFLLALGTAAEQIDLALLTVQGVPVYRVSCAAGDRRVSVKTSAVDKLPPLALLNYLSMIFMDRDALSQQLQTGWTLQTHISERALMRSNTAIGVRINYHGTAPWFHSIELVDNLRDVTLSIVILESFRVLPE